MKFRNNLSILFILLISSSFGQVPSTLSQKLQNKIDSLLLATNIKGLSTCVIDPLYGTWRGTSGFSFSNQKIESEMQFGIASNTKLFTGVIILKLKENNLLHLDDSIYHFFSAHTNIDSTITIRELLNHTSGLKDVNETPGYPDSIMSNTTRVFSASEIIKWIGPPSFVHGSSWEYSNTNYLLAGIIAETITGKKISTLIRDSILTPLNLDSTFFDVAEPVLGSKAHPWHMGIDINSIPRVSLNSAAGAAGGMYSNAGDMAKWYNALFDGKILNASSLEDLTKFTGSGNYGIGISKQTLGGRTVYIHGGDIRGYRSQMVYDSALKISISVLCNSNPAPVTLIARELLLTVANYTATGTNTHPPQGRTFMVFPNPSKGIFQLPLPKNTNDRILVYDNNHRFMFEIHDTTIDLLQEQSGTYWLQYINPKMSYMIPLIKID